LNTKESRKKMTRAQLGPVALSPVLVTLILFSYIQGCFIQPSYADQQEEGVRTLGIKAYIENIVVQQGKTQTIHFQVADQKSHQPIGAAITSATVSYADGKTVRHFSVPTDASGRSSISWRIERNAPAGLYNVVYSVAETGYVPESFGGSFSVVAHSVKYGCLSSSSSSSSSDSSLSVLDIAGPLTHIAGSQTSHTCSAVSSGPSTHIAGSKLSNTTKSSITIN
jgi:hypothetical protein